MNIRLFVSDLDGTLLNQDHRISEKSSEIILDIQRAGGLFLAATGRAWKSVNPILNDAGISCGAILLNGAEFRTENGNILFHRFIDQAGTDRILHLLQKYRIDFEVHTNRGDFSIYSEMNHELRDLQDMIRCLAAQALHDPGPDQREEIRILKFFIPCHAFWLYDGLIKELEDIGGISITTSGSCNLEITSSDATKADMLKQVAAYYGITEPEIAVFGDSENDKTMLKEFRNSFAVENAPDDVRSCASSVIGCNDEDAAALKMRDIFLTKAGSSFCIQ